MVSVFDAQGLLTFARIEDMEARLEHHHVSGNIGQDLYVAARTYGDGACGLHSLFGSSYDGSLYCPNVLVIAFVSETCTSRLADMFVSHPVPQGMSSCGFMIRHDN